MNSTIKSFFLFLIYLLLVALVLARGVSDGFTGDEAAYVAPNTAEMAAHPLVPFVLHGVDTGHPLLFVYPVALWRRFFGHSNAAANVSIWLWAALALTAMHRMMGLILGRGPGEGEKPAGGAECRFRRKRPTDALAALALFSTPLFISLAAQYLDPMPYLALLLWLLLAWATGRRAWIAVLASAVALTRITAWMSVLGLGLFDLAYTFFILRRRSARALALTLAPYAVSAAVFLLYLSIKLFLLHRPLSTLAVNSLMIGTWDYIRFSTGRVLAAILSAPAYSFKPLLAVAALAALVSLLRRKFVVPPSGGTPMECPPNAATIYGACIASMILPTLFYCLYPFYPQPRYLLPWHAFIILGGAHGLLTLAGRRPALALAPLALWCGLQVARWHNHWVDRWLRRPSMRMAVSFNLDVTYRKALYRQAARWMETQDRTAPVIAAYPTRMVFQLASTGYLEPWPTVLPVNDVVERKPPTFLNELLARTPRVFFVQSSWDLSRERQMETGLMRGCPLATAFESRARSGEWIRISSCPAPPTTEVAR